MMTTRMTRRQALRLALVGGLGSLAAACTSRATPTAAPGLPTQILPTWTPLPASSGNETVVMTSTPPAETIIMEATPQAALDAGTQVLVSDIGVAAASYLASLDEGQRAKGTYLFTDSERLRWHWTTPRNFPRNGLPLNEMNQGQRDLAFALLKTSVSEAGFQKALDIISLQNDLGNDPQLYYVTVFGTPGGVEPWSWRFEGHHLSRHFTILGSNLAVTPFFLGAWPTVNNAGLKTMDREEWAARELTNSLLASGH